MSDSPQTETVRLVVRAEDPAAEVFIIDRAFRLVERGRGRLQVELPPGIYKVKARAGHETWEQHVVLRPGSPVDAEVPLRFASPVPLPNTSRWDPAHETLAARESRRVHVPASSGSSVFVMAREWTAVAEATGETLPHPMRGLTLRRDGEVVADLAVAAVAAEAGQTRAACATAQVDPGFYTLTLELASGRLLHQPVIASRGWQTQVFMLLRDYAQDDRRADLPGAAIHLSRDGFQAQAGQLRLGELARLAVAHDRWVVSDQLKRILAQKYENPMLGILGGHLLLMEPEPDLPLLAEVVNNLRGLLGAGSHPDVEALALRTPAADSGYHFTVPPMLRKSWELVIEASASIPVLVPPGSLAESVSGRALASEPWLAWCDPEPEEAGSGHEAENNAAFVLKQLRELLKVVVDATVPQEANGGRTVPPLQAGWLVARHLRAVVGPEARRAAGLLAAKVATEAWRLVGTVFTTGVASPTETPSIGRGEDAAEAPPGAGEAGDAVQDLAGAELAVVCAGGADQALAAAESAPGGGAVAAPAEAVRLDMEVRQLRQKLSPEAVRRLMRTFGVPRARLEHLLDTLEHPGTLASASASEPGSGPTQAQPAKDRVAEQQAEEQAEQVAVSASEPGAEDAQANPADHRAADQTAASGA